MKKLMNLSLAMMAVSTSGCSSTLVQSKTGEGRIIEFKSGPEGFDTRTFFYEGKNEVIAIDAQFTEELAKKSIDHLRTFTSKPITWLIITHPNPDKFNGASVFKSEGAQIIASKKTAEAIPGVHGYKEYFFVEMAKMFKKGEYPQPTEVDQTFDLEMDLVLGGGERILLRELSSPGVSSTQSVVYIKSIKALLVGDLVHYKAHAWLEGGIVNGQATPTLEGWINDLNEIAEIFPKNTMVYGGRGSSVRLEIAAKEQIQYLKEAKSLVQQQIQILGDKAVEFKGPKAGVLYKKLAQTFQEKFPDYDLSYMIEYGAYGLVLSEL